MIIRHPVASLVVSGRPFTAAEAAVGTVDVRLASGGEHDSARLVLWSTSRAAGASTGDRIAIALGERGDVVDVWAGTVVRAERADGQVVLDALAHTAPLSRERRAQAWQDQTVADIVRDLVGAVAIEEVDASLQLPWFAVDTQRSVWSHLRDLAHLVGAELGSSPNGAVRFVPVAASRNVHTLRYGAELVRWKLADHDITPARGASAYGAASEAGAQQWHWLMGAGGGNSGGGSAPALAGVLRTRDAADAVAKGRAERQQRRTRQGLLLAVGTPAIRPGDGVSLTSVPGVPDARYRVRTVHHRLDGRLGMSTTLTVEGAAA